MATTGIVNSLTQNPIEVQDLSQFIIEQVYSKPELLKIHHIETGVKMKEQIVFASLMGLSGLAKSTSSCARQTSNNTSSLTQKYWIPVGIEDTLILCEAPLNSLFKAYFTKIKNYREMYDIQGSDLEVFFSILFLETMNDTIWRAAWFADEDWVAATSSTAGVKDSADVPYFTYFDGLWNQIFTAVTATTVSRYTISALVATDGTVKTYTIFEGMWALADSRLKGMKGQGLQMLVTDSVFENYRLWLTAASIAFEVTMTMDGLSSLTWNGIEVVNMGEIWDNSINRYVDNTTDNNPVYPNRCVLTVRENIPIGTLNEDDFDNLELFYDQVSRQVYMGYGFTLDSKLLNEYLLVAAY